jgi:flagellar assembly protein FliH
LAYKKYMFDLDFGAPPSRPGAVPVEVAEPELDLPVDLPPPPTFTEEDLEVVRAAAFTDGQQAGLVEAAEATERKLADSCDRMADGIAALCAAQERSADEAKAVAARVALSVLRKVLPAACETHAFDEVIRMVEECFSHVLDEPRIIVRVAPPLVDPVRERLEAAALGHGFEGRVVVQPDPRLPMGDCRVEWADGGADRDQARLIADIEDAVNRALAPPDPREAS